MIPRGCKRLAEVDFPIAAVSRHAAREKSIRHGHPSTLHLWWARRPLASSRAVLLALLWPDPCDARCPAAFKEAARALLPSIPHCNPGAGDAALRAALLRFIADFANWDLAAHADYLRVSRALVKAALGEGVAHDLLEERAVLDAAFAFPGLVLHRLAGLGRERVVGIEGIAQQRMIGQRPFQPDEEEIGKVRIGNRVVIGWIGEPDSSGFVR